MPPTVKLARDVEPVHTNEPGVTPHVADSIVNQPSFHLDPTRAARPQTGS